MASVQRQPPEVSIKKVFLKISEDVQENTCVGISLIEFQGSSVQLYEKRDSNTGIFP